MLRCIMIPSTDSTVRARAARDRRYLKKHSIRVWTFIFISFSAPPRRLLRRRAANSAPRYLHAQVDNRMRLLRLGAGVACAFGGGFIAAAFFTRRRRLRRVRPLTSPEMILP